MKSIAVVLLGLALVASVMALDFGYDDTSTSLPGPSSWGTLPGSQVCSTGRFQSPINIISSFVEYHANYGRLAYTYTKDSQITITETGHTVFLSSTGFADNTLTVKNVLNGTYVLDNIVFHWGQDNSVGSEHLVDFVPTVGEIQFVHYNNMFASLTTAISSKQFNAVAIISVPLVIGRSSPKNFTALVNNMNTTAGPMSSSIVGPLDFTTFFPANKVYYTYSGSLTTPTCDEVVQWFVFANPLKVSQTDFNRLRKVPLETSATTFGAGSNYRPTQTLYGRKVTSNFIPNNQASSASGLVASLALCLCAAVMALTGF